MHEEYLFVYVFSIIVIVMFVICFLYLGCGFILTYFETNQFNRTFGTNYKTMEMFLIGDSIKQRELGYKQHVVMEKE